MRADPWGGWQALKGTGLVALDKQVSVMPYALSLVREGHSDTCAEWWTPASPRTFILWGFTARLTGPTLRRRGFLGPLANVEVDFQLPGGLKLAMGQVGTTARVELDPFGLKGTWIFPQPSRLEVGTRAAIVFSGNETVRTIGPVGILAAWIEEKGVHRGR